MKYLHNQEEEEEEEKGRSRPAVRWNEGKKEKQNNRSLVLAFWTRSILHQKQNPPPLQKSVGLLSSILTRAALPKSKATHTCLSDNTGINLSDMISSNFFDAQTPLKLEGFDLGWVCWCVERTILTIYLWCLKRKWWWGGEGEFGPGTYKRHSW